MKLRIRSRLRSSRGWLLLLATGASIGLLGFRLVSLAPGLASVETPLQPSRQLLELIWNQPLELPLHAARLLVAGISPATGVGLSRLPNVLLGLVVIGLMYWLLKRWYGYRLAVFGTLLMATAPWFLHVARLASDDIIYPLAMAIALTLVAAWHQPERRQSLVYLSVLAAAMLLYIPGGVWLLVGGAFFERRNIITTLRRSKLHTGLAAVFGVALLAPLGHAAYLDWHIYRPLLGLPAVLPAPLDFIIQIGKSWRYIFINGYDNPVYNVGLLPIIDVLTSLSFLIGIYLYAQHPKATRTRQLTYLWLVGSLLVALGTHGGPVAITLLLPIIVVLSTGGIGYLLHLWLKVFPRNPIARTFGIGLMAIVVLFAVGYNVRNYFIAWPNNAATRAAFQRQP